MDKNAFCIFQISWQVEWLGMKISPKKKVIVMEVLGKGLKDLDMKFHLNRFAGAGDITYKRFS